MAQELKVIADCYDLPLYLSQRVEKFPRSHRYTLGADIERRAQSLLGQLVRAKYTTGTEARAARLREVNAELEVLRFQVRLARVRSWTGCRRRTRNPPRPPKLPPCA